MVMCHFTKIVASFFFLNGVFKLGILSVKGLFASKLRILLEKNTNDWGC